MTLRELLLVVCTHDVLSTAQCNRMVAAVDRFLPPSGLDDFEDVAGFRAHLGAVGTEAEIRTWAYRVMRSALVPDAMAARGWDCMVNELVRDTDVGPILGFGSAETLLTPFDFGDDLEVWKALAVGAVRTLGARHVETLGELFSIYPTRHLTPSLWRALRNEREPEAKQTLCERVLRALVTDMHEARLRAWDNATKRT